MGDWTSFRERLAAAKHRLGAIDQPPNVEYERLAAGSSGREAAEAAEPLPDRAELVIFRIGNERYAVNAIEVLEVVQLSRVTALPGVPAFYRGLITHRGIVFPLIDIRPLIGRTGAEGSTPQQAVLFLSEEYAVAVAADEAEAFSRIEASEIAAVSEEERTGSAAIRGLTNDGIVVLDAGALLADARLVIDDRSSRG